MRDPSESELAHVADVLQRLREHFHEWHSEGHELMEFAYYEGCGDSEHCGDILAEAAPFALGAELVARHGFRWVMLSGKSGPRYGVTHPVLSDPIDLESLEDGSWYEDDPDRDKSRGAVTTRSLETIVERVASLSPPAPAPKQAKGRRKKS